jgi:hypothetical protein
MLGGALTSLVSTGYGLRDEPNERHTLDPEKRHHAHVRIPVEAFGS